jgi:hypothetical protein
MVACGNEGPVGFESEFLASHFGQVDILICRFIVEIGTDAFVAESF